MMCGIMDSTVRLLPYSVFSIGEEAAFLSVADSSLRARCSERAS